MFLNSVPKEPATPVEPVGLHLPGKRSRRKTRTAAAEHKPVLSEAVRRVNLVVVDDPPGSAVAASTLRKICNAKALNGHFAPPLAAPPPRLFTGTLIASRRTVILRDSSFRHSHMVNGEIKHL
jgi:hypothetical protein